jgi:hypothetical protein
VGQKMNRLNGSCFCKNICFGFSTEIPPEELSYRTCSCEFCTKHGSVYISDPNGSLDIVIANESTVIKYKFETETADFIICSHCGAMPVVVSRIEGKLYGVVNAKCIDDPIRISEPTNKDFSGETKEERLNRRKKAWISTVKIL